MTDNLIDTLEKALESVRALVEENQKLRGELFCKTKVLEWYAYVEASERLRDGGGRARSALKL